MKSYLVGGAVRDQLLGLPVHERDYVVVGATPETLLDAGFTPVGQDFPVFLHPDTREEYALARTERKTGRGYKGFTFHATPEVTLTEDLRRRDLTINAMAQTESGAIIDPFGGQEDLRNRQLRHVSAAFTEDPLRVLRVARFAARFTSLGFTLAPETQHLMQQLAQSGELANLTRERLWQETAKAMVTPTPAVYFNVLQQCQALAQLLSTELPKTLHWSALEAWSADPACPHQLTSPPEPNPARVAGPWALASADLARQAGSALATRWQEVFHAPNQCRDYSLLLLAIQEWLSPTSAPHPDGAFALLQQLDSWRRPERATDLLQLAHYLPQVPGALARLQTGFAAARGVDVQPILAAGYTGPAISQELNRRRAAAIAECWS